MKTITVRNTISSAFSSLKDSASYALSAFASIATTAFAVAAIA